MKLDKKIILGTAALVGILAMPSAFRNTETHSTGCEIYQGYRNFDGERIYFFDSNKEDERSLSPKYPPLAGDYKLKDSLTIGQRYCFEFKDPITPWGIKSIVGIPQAENQDTQKRE